MAKYIYQSNADRKLIENFYSYVANMILGSKKDTEKAIMADMFEKGVKKVEIYP